ncbi:GntR family transcriptional regulator [Mycolicibacterium confluentis]|uniref:Transcriptional regulator n=1 Tax=Mycolicibacterium confluentis TaxID=28047 RepID=A0A7I7XWZ3_9MYCO|nr:GntR family transcriptional regulator [Mycolicibacterium confluentis]MCV7321712.1 GntR family transcriptional regulator [Mycolicibacterium confluentis]ORV31994.1 GntR family transcriptional regulator [Mycolicibacterium confluentis]BBZ33523.1 transcriptional regulator [Mycolicibacterium confluentis]
MSVAPESDLPVTLVELAASRLRDAILSGALAPGAKIVEEQLCADFGISRAPLREALRQLAQQGLVEHLPRRGSRVAEWSPEDIRQLFELRTVLERHAVETALPLSDPETALAPVHAALKAMEAASTDLARDDAHRAFHAAVVGLAANRQLDITLEPILLKLQLPMAANLRGEARHHHREDGVARHRAILTALENNDTAAAVEATSGHGHLTYLPL